MYTIFCQALDSENYTDEIIRFHTSGREQNGQIADGIFKVFSRRNYFICTFPIWHIGQLVNLLIRLISTSMFPSYEYGVFLIHYALNVLENEKCAFPIIPLRSFWDLFSGRKNIPVSYSQYHEWRWSDDGKSDGMSDHGIDLCTGLSTRKFMWFSYTWQFTQWIYSMKIAVKFRSSN